MFWYSQIHKQVHRVPTIRTPWTSMFSELQFIEFGFDWCPKRQNNATPIWKSLFHIFSMKLTNKCKNAFILFLWASYDFPMFFLWFYHPWKWISEFQSSRDSEVTTSLSSKVPKFQSLSFLNSQFEKTQVSKFSNFKISKCIDSNISKQ